ncbi:hypothetical protein SDC9_153941 [bioreactor metagenome]|uniref:Uncharacterized protein n=1 Tax=bioreactor metagenome TaxID=1076179 RepID=A0A645EXA9_9ZZZZ
MQCGHRLDGVGAADEFRAGLGKAKVFDLPRLDEVFDGTGDIFCWDCGVHAVLVEEVNGLHSQPLEGGFCNFFDVFWAAIHAGHGITASFAEVELPTKFSSDEDFAFEGFEGFTDQLLIGEGAVNLSGIKEGDTTLHCLMQEGDHLLFVGGGVPKAHTHTAQAEG